MARPNWDTIVIGGGFFGCCAALFLRGFGQRVMVLEQDKDLLLRASYNNQARIHNGYHYPRSILTALRSHLNFSRFTDDFRDCVFDTFDKYYAVGRRFSKVTATQFKLFVDRIGAPLKAAPKTVKKLFNPRLIEDVFAVEEYAFDPVKLRILVRNRLEEAGVTIRFGCKALRVSTAHGEGIEVTYVENSKTIDEQKETSNHVLNCTYSQLNQVLHGSGLPLIPLKHELTEMVLIEPPPELRELGVTVMCGPFFSFMPFPPRNLHTLSHVRYTPHHHWFDGDRSSYFEAYTHFHRASRKSHVMKMIRDVERYLPSIRECRHSGESIWEVKTLLPYSEVDDSRPILYMDNYGGINGLTCIIGGKFDNIYDMYKEMENKLNLRGLQ